MIRLVVGLGNPGPAYEATRHNAGFWWVDALAAQLKTTLTPERAYQGLLARVAVPLPGVAGPLWLLQPMTYMNRSGVSVATLARFFKIAPGEILVVHDELDLAPGQAKLKLGGSAAGHNGLKDIHGMLGSPEHWRLRLGIGHPGHRDAVADYVLKKPSAADRDAIGQAIEQSLKALPALLAGEMDRALAVVHAKPPRPKPPRPPVAPALPGLSASPASPTPPLSSTSPAAWPTPAAPTAPAAPAAPSAVTAVDAVAVTAEPSSPSPIDDERPGDSR